MAYAAPLSCSWCRRIAKVRRHTAATAEWYGRQAPGRMSAVTAAALRGGSPWLALVVDSS